MESQTAVYNHEGKHHLRAHAQETGDVDLSEDPADGKAFCAQSSCEPSAPHLVVDSQTASFSKLAAEFGRNW